ncbi:MAG: response regulator [Nitrospirales bacterium]|nr:response regulator [Nitrospirales bacterium]
MNTLVLPLSSSRTCSTSDNSRVLVIDDDAALLESLAEMLTIRLGRVHVDTCSNPASAEAMVRRGQYDLILCDVWMAPVSGLTLLPQLRKAAPEASIIMMSGVTNNTVRSQALASGATTFLPKPFDRDSLTLMLKQVLNERHLAYRRAAPRTTM